MNTTLWNNFIIYCKSKCKIRFAILSVFLGLSIIATLITSSYTYWQMEKIMKVTSRDLIDKTQNIIINDTLNYLSPARFIPLISSDLTKYESQGLLQNPELESFLIRCLNEFPQIDAFYNGDENGNTLIVGRIGSRRLFAFSKDKPLPNEAYYFVRKIKHDAFFQENRFYLSKQGNLVTEEENTESIPSFDPRQRPWYSNVKEKKKSSWTDVYLYETGELGLTYAVPGFDHSGNFNKVLSADITLTKISDFLLHQKVSRSGINFIVKSDGSLVGYRDISKIVLTQNIQTHTVHINQLNEPSLSRAYQLYLKTHETHLFFTFDNIDYIAHFTPFPSSLGNDWILGMVVPADDFIGPIKQTSREVLLISLIILGIASLTLVIFSHKISYPIERLAGQMLKIRTLDIEEVNPIESNLQELVQMDDALKAMKEGLNSFSKFVPKSLVQRLIASGHEATLGGERKKITLLFTDIENFTAISEAMPTDLLIRHLSEYLNELSLLILSHHGTIDKYIGDSIMAFWGAPDRDDQQIIHACHTVWLCQKRLNELNKTWHEQGKPIFKTRFGLHQGEVIVGNVGSADRLNYTVIGDPVNLSSRLEEINKYYRTSILVSHFIYEKAKNKYLFSPVDRVAVKGREQGIQIYQLMGKIDENPMLGVTLQDKAYASKTQQAFEEYLKQNWSKAEKLYQELNLERPEDKIPIIFLDRILHFKENPPTADWDGIFHALVK